MIWPREATSLGTPLPAVLRGAITAQWHGLSAPARTVTRLLAVAGRPVPPQILESVGIADLGTARAVDAAVHEATARGGLAAPERGKIWFRHPLLAEVLLADVLPDELVGLHERYVDTLSRGAPDDLRTVADLAVHLDGAGRTGEALEQYRKAAARAAAADAFSQQAELVRRAARIADSVDLWLDAAWACFRAGEFSTGTTCAERARGLAERAHASADALRALLVWLELERANGRPRTTQQSEPDPAGRSR